MKRRTKKENPKQLMTITPEMMEKVEASMQDFTENLIDLPMNEFCQVIERNNIGDLKIKRLYLEQKMFEVDAMCAAALNPNVLVAKLNKEQALELAQLFAVLAKIEAKRGVIDYLIFSRQAASYQGGN